MQWKLDHFDWTCSGCKAEVARENQEIGLPPLQGSDKQIEWAELIRKKKVEELVKYQQRLFSDKSLANANQYIAAVDKAIMNKSAHWWIEMRSKHVEDMVAIAKKTLTAIDLMPAAEQALYYKAEKNAIAEALLRPETSCTENHAEIRVVERRIEIDFPEHNEVFIETVKKIGYQWDKENLYWTRQMSDFTGAVEDRVVETAVRLLAKGFPVLIFDERLRNLAISGEYVQETKKWVDVVSSGKYKGWFALIWPYGEDYYDVARALKGSKYSKPNVIVPPAQFDQVTDFAQMYGFRFSAAATEALESAKEARDRALVIKVAGESPDEASKAAVQQRRVRRYGRRKYVSEVIVPKALPVPETVAIPDDLRDEDESEATDAA
jgi:hypothetical protein